MTKKIQLIYASFIASMLSVLVHNILLSMMDVREWFFFGLAILLLMAFFIVLLYSIMEFIITKEPADLWKVGFLGLFGLIALVPGFGPSFFGFFALFGLFGTREYF